MHLIYKLATQKYIKTAQNYIKTPTQCLQFRHRGVIYVNLF